MLKTLFYIPVVHFETYLYLQVVHFETYLVICQWCTLKHTWLPSGGELWKHTWLPSGSALLNIPGYLPVAHFETYLVNGDHYGSIYLCMLFYISTKRGRCIFPANNALKLLGHKCGIGFEVDHRGLVEDTAGQQKKKKKSRQTTSWGPQPTESLTKISKNEMNLGFVSFWFIGPVLWMQNPESEPRALYIYISIAHFQLLTGFSSCDWFFLFCNSILTTVSWCSVSSRRYWQAVFPNIDTCVYTVVWLGRSEIICGQLASYRQFSNHRTSLNLVGVYKAKLRNN